MSVTDHACHYEVMKRRLFGVIAIAGLLVLADCGATGQSAADEVVQGLPENWEGPQPDLIAAEPVAGWVGDSSFGIVTFGSGSCPLVAESVKDSGAGTVIVDFRASANDPCTADLSMVTHVFSLPGSVTERPVSIISFVDGEITLFELR